MSDWLFSHADTTAMIRNETGPNRARNMNSAAVIGATFVMLSQEHSTNPGEN